MDVGCLHHSTCQTFTEIYQILQVFLLKVWFLISFYCVILFVISEEVYEISEVSDPLARVDIRVSGFWRCLHHHTFFDVRVFNCFAASNSSTLATIFRKFELEKHAYEEHIREVEHGSFTLLLQVAWERLLPPLTNTLPACSVRSGVPHILWWWAGPIVVWGSPCCILQ